MDFPRLIRVSVYYKPRPVFEVYLKLMHWIDKLRIEFTFADSRILQGLLVQEGFKAGPLHVGELRSIWAALYRRPNTTKPARGHKRYPHFLINLPITRHAQVWIKDIP